MATHQRAPLMRVGRSPPSVRPCPVASSSPLSSMSATSRTSEAVETYDMLGNLPAFDDYLALATIAPGDRIAVANRFKSRPIQSGKWTASSTSLTIHLEIEDHFRSHFETVFGSVS